MSVSRRRLVSETISLWFHSSSRDIGATVTVRSELSDPCLGRFSQCVQQFIRHDVIVVANDDRSVQLL